MTNYLKSRYMPVTKCMYMNHVGQSQCRTFLPQGKVIEIIVVAARDGNDHLRLLPSVDGKAHLPMEVPGPMAHLRRSGPREPWAAQFLLLVTRVKFSKPLCFRPVILF